MSRLSIAVSPADHQQGDTQAKCILVEYGDYECPHCGKAHGVVKRLQKRFGKDLLFVFRNFPLTQTHRNAERAAETAEFAAAGGKFREMHDLLFEHQRNLEFRSLLTLAEKIGLSPNELSQALESGTFLARVRSDFSGGVRSGVNGTPSFFINGERHDKGFDFETLDHALEKQIAAGTPS